MYNNALNAYKSVEKATVSGRETEARVLTEGCFKTQDLSKKVGRSMTGMSCSMKP